MTMQFGKSRAALCLLLIWMTSACATAQVIAVKAGRVVDPASDTVTTNQVILVMKGETRGTLAMEYIDSFFEAGVPAKQILKAMTTDAVRLLGVAGERGAIKVGMAADLIAVAGNPAENIQALKPVTFVMKNGVVVKRSE